MNPAAFVCFGAKASCAPGDCGGAEGWSVRYRHSQPENGPEKCEAIVRLNVTAASHAGFSGVRFAGFDVPFVVDTGASVTMIPRRWLQWRAGEALYAGSHGVHHIKDVSGHAIIGQYHWATLSLNPPDSACAPLIFPPIQVFVPNASLDARGSVQLALLGMNALREVITTFQRSKVTFRRHPPPAVAGVV